MNEYAEILSNLKSLKGKSKKTTTKLNTNNVKAKAKLGNLARSISMQVVATTALTLVLNNISYKNKKVAESVDNTNELIDKANLSQSTTDINSAVNSINASIRLIQDCESKIESIQQKLGIYKTTINITQVVVKAVTVALEILFASPAPSKPGAHTLATKIEKLSKMLDGLFAVVNVIVPPIFSGILAELNEQKERIKTLQTQISSLVTSAIKSTNVADSGLIIALDDINIPLVNNITDDTLGVVDNIQYKGFQFVIKEENNPQFTINGHKRKYGVVINSNGREVLKTDPSFTLQPDTLIDQLKIEIDRLGLKGY